MGRRQNEIVRRVAVVGGPGSGKSTTASTVAKTLGVPHVELDALWWRPEWTPAELHSFRKTVADLASSDAWVIDGNYLDEAGCDIVWPRADTLVWLDPPRHVAVARALRRAILRVATQSLLWGTNRQGPSTLSPASIGRLVRRWPTYSLRIESALADQAFPHLTVVRLHSDADVEGWLQGLEERD